MRQPIIEHQCTVTVRKVKKLPDLRFKTGYRAVETIATSSAYIYPLYPDPINPNRKSSGTTLNLSHIDKRKDNLYQTAANVEVNLILTEAERKL